MLQPWDSCTRFLGQHKYIFKSRHQIHNKHASLRGPCDLVHFRVLYQATSVSTVGVCCCEKLFISFSYVDKRSMLTEEAYYQSCWTRFRRFFYV